MSGNVWEWCWDWYRSYGGGVMTDPTGAELGSYRVVRGGGWNSGARDCRSANRMINAPDYKFGYLGLRLCRTAP